MTELSGSKGFLAKFTLEMDLITHFFLEVTFNDEGNSTLENSFFKIYESFSLIFLKHKILE